MKIRNVILAVGMMAMGATAFGVGCGGNPCQDYNDALTKAAGGKGCSILKSAELPASEVSNCPSNFSTYSDCVTGCLGKLKDCTSASDVTAFDTCYAGCASKM